MDIISVNEALGKPVNECVSLAVKVLHRGEVETYNNNDKERRYFISTVADESGHAKIRVYSIKTQTDFIPDNSLMLHNIVRKYGKESFWFVSSSRAGSWAPVFVPENILEASRSASSASSAGSKTPTKLSEAINSTSTISIQGKVVQSSPLRHTRDGSLPTKFISLKDEKTGPTVKCALFGIDASKQYNEGDVVAITDAYKWKQTETLSTKRTTQVEFRPTSTLQFEVTANDKLDDPDFSDPDQAAEAFIVKGVISAHTYACCPKKTCRNKKLAEQKCPNCQELVNDNNTEYYCIADTKN